MPKAKVPGAGCGSPAGGEAEACASCDGGGRPSDRRLRTAVDTLIVLAGVYPDVESAERDYDLVQELHSAEGLMDAYDAAVIHRREDGRVKIARKHETPTRVGGVLGGGAGLATGVVVALFPKLQKKQLEADVAAIERDARDAAGQ